MAMSVKNLKPAAKLHIFLLSERELAREDQTMALKKLRMICAGGDKTLAEWDTDTVSTQRLAEIETEFKEKMAQGWFAADISEKRDVLIREFDPNAEILLIPRVQGGL